MLGKFFAVIAFDMAIALLVMNISVRGPLLRGLLWLIGVDEIDMSSDQPKKASDIQLMLALSTTFFTAFIWHYSDVWAGLLAFLAVNVLWRALKETFPTMGL